MIDLHTVATPNGHKISIMLEEVGLPYKVIPYDIFKGEQFKSELLEINPNNKLPAILDREPMGGGEPFAVFESGAILAYLADKTGRLWGATPRQRHTVLQWLMFQMAGLGPMHGQAHHFVRYAPEKIPYALDRYMNEAKRLLRVMDKRLGEAEYLAGEYSIADIASWPWIRGTRLISVSIEEYPNLQRWYRAIEARPAVERGGAVINDSIKTRPASAKVVLDLEQWSVLFGARQHAKQ
ncbi:MAG: glutathione S-transferase C-terminal domain-containing protein [Alphaproteobacteria bacterium]